MVGTTPLKPARWDLRFLAVVTLGTAVCFSFPTVANAARSTTTSPTSAPAVRPCANPGTVYDDRLDVTWLADADLAAKPNCSFGVPGINKDGSMSYQSALDWVRALDTYDNKQGYLGHNDWTLPLTPPDDKNCSSFNKETFGYNCRGSALGSLYYVTLGLHWPGTAVAVPDVSTGPLHDFQPYLYWTATQAKKQSQGYETFSFNTGWSGANVSQHSMYVLPMVLGNPFNIHTTSDRGRTRALMAKLSTTRVRE